MTAHHAPVGAPRDVGRVVDDAGRVLRADRALRLVRVLQDPLLWEYAKRRVNMTLMFNCFSPQASILPARCAAK